MHDPEIRELLKASLIDECRSGAEIIEELGIGSGTSRADVTVIGEDLHVFEIKSDFDSLVRLPDQLSYYAKIFDRITVVTAYRHLDKILEMAMPMCGIILAKERPSELGVIRRAAKNTEIQPIELAGLLWKEEALGILEHYGGGRNARKTRDDVFGELSERVPLNELRALVIKNLRSRNGLGLVGKRTRDGD